MPKKAKKYLITTEKREIFIVRQNGHEAIQGFCPTCAFEVGMLTFDAAISFTGISGRELIRRFESGELHSIETTGGHFLVCRDSLKDFLKTGEEK
jgi:hypothetical protein